MEDRQDILDWLQSMNIPYKRLTAKRPDIRRAALNRGIRYVYNRRHKVTPMSAAWAIWEKAKGFTGYNLVTEEAPTTLLLVKAWLATNGIHFQKLVYRSPGVSASNLMRASLTLYRNRPLSLKRLGLAPLIMRVAKKMQAGAT